MIKRVITAALAISAIAGMAQAADTANGNINLSATVGNTCYIKGITQNTLSSGADFSGGAEGTNTSAVLNLGASTINPDTAIAAASSNTLTISAYCNYAQHSIGLSSKNGGLTRATQATVEGNFAQRISYNATLSGWGSTTLSPLAATGDVASATAVEKKVAASVATAVNTTNSLNAVKTLTTLKIDTVAGVNPLVQGAYSDILTLRLGAAL